MALLCRILRQTGKTRPRQTVCVNGAEVRGRGWWLATCRRVPGAVQDRLTLQADFARMPKSLEAAAGPRLLGFFIRLVCPAREYQTCLGSLGLCALEDSAAPAWP